ncbi:MAG: hypothetical protein Q9168_003291 [Polycauliona sp. 1 TL-2023]
MGRYQSRAYASKADVTGFEGELGDGSNKFPGESKNHTTPNGSSYTITVTPERLQNLANDMAGEIRRKEMKASRAAGIITLSVEAYKDRVRAEAHEIIQSKIKTVIWLFLASATMGFIYVCFIDRDQWDSDGNFIATVPPIAYIRCKLSSEEPDKSLLEYATRKAASENAIKGRFSEMERQLSGDILVPVELVQKALSTLTEEDWDELPEYTKTLLAAEVQKHLRAVYWAQRGMYFRRKA